MIQKNWFLYILKCADKTYYTGITNNLTKRLEAHQKGIGARYTSSKRPVKLVYQENNLTESQARKKEILIKSWNRHKKEELIYGEVA